MPISMNPQANYVTPHIYFNVAGKPLTNRRIAYWQKHGKYGTSLGAKSAKSAAPRRKRNVLAELLKTFGV